MRMRTRLMLIFLAIGLIPLVAAALVAVYTVTQMYNLALSTGEANLAEAGQRAIRAQGQAVAREIQLYLSFHPEIDLSDTAALEANTELAAIAVQPVGQTGYTAVYDSNGFTHFHANPAIVGMDMSTLAVSRAQFWAIFEASLDGSPSEGYYEWEEADGSVRNKWMACVPVEGTPLRVAATTYLEEFSQPVVAQRAELERLAANSRLLLGVTAAVIGLIAVGGAIFWSARFTRPIRELATAATRVMQGEWTAIHPTTRRDELGVLNRTLRAMIGQLEGALKDLERQVTARTRDLARRTSQLEVAAEVAREAAEIRDIGQLLDAAVHLISDRFGFYHAGIFLLDEAGEYAMLRAASSPGGQRMLARGHRLQVGKVGIVGYVAASGEPRIALDVGADAVFFDNPDLPQTRSEMGLPLKARGRVIGVLDVQSTAGGAFAEEDIATLSVMADQLAIAIENAQLFQRSDEQLRELSTLYRHYGQEAWQRIGQLEGLQGYRYDGASVVPVAEPPAPVEAEAMGPESGLVVQDAAGRAMLAVPIRVRDMVIANLSVRKPQGEELTPEDVEFIQTLAAELGSALESARLYADAQRRAERERLVSETSARVREALDVDLVLQAAAGEIRRVLSLAEVEVRLGAGPAVDEAGGDTA